MKINWAQKMQIVDDFESQLKNLDSFSLKYKGYFLFDSNLLINFDNHKHNQYFHNFYKIILFILLFLAFFVSLIDFYFVLLFFPRFGLYHLLSLYLVILLLFIG